MTTRWNKAGPLQAAAIGGAGAAPRPASTVVRAPFGREVRGARLTGVDPWLAASLTGDLFATRFLWASDCGRQRFAALGERGRVPYHQLGAALRDCAEELDLREDLASRLPLGLFVLGETDERPGAFGRDEAETSARCWIPEVLLLQDGNDVVVICADEALRLDVERRLAEVQDHGQDPSVRLGLPGCRPDLLETVTDSRETWKQRVARALADIDRGPLEKVVVSRRLVFEPENMPFSPTASGWNVSRAIGRTGFSITTDAGKSSFIAATPETLLRVHDRSLSTHALAGTRPGDAALEDFLTSTKLSREHQYVSDGIIGSLAPYVRNIRSEQLRVRRAGLVTHLELPLGGDLRNGADPLDILSVLHPTAAIGGWPQHKAMQALQQIEPYSRGWFAAPVGWLAANGDMHATIAIRSLWVQRERAVALAGAGIVKGSVAEDEWDETEDKFDNMRAAIRGRIIDE
jgi:menaquinone-specific isochorismate synthase